eukprot:CAMPEP_0117892666 /NCGR_PEP_ID=MMETSP0950-20121206/24802_1 /TAXON_ID=44440 /ORGANISM="Chattonella subsalsa, Strain CCMP2191" /LENGTH=55 /DNA_ID=CAMNT_0005752649 /DNA_START=1158 /DNA_END=1321 /DNA_ORIENTATION=-
MRRAGAVALPSQGPLARYGIRRSAGLAPWEARPCQGHRVLLALEEACPCGGEGVG